MSPGGGDTQKHSGLIAPRASLLAITTSVARYHDYSDHHARRPLSLPGATVSCADSGKGDRGCTHRVCRHPHDNTSICRSCGKDRDSVNGNPNVHSNPKQPGSTRTAAGINVTWDGALDDTPSNTTEVTYGTARGRRVPFAGRRCFGPPVSSRFPRHRTPLLLWFQAYSPPQKGCCLPTPQINPLNDGRQQQA